MGIVLVDKATGNVDNKKLESVHEYYKPLFYLLNKSGTQILKILNVAILEYSIEAFLERAERIALIITELAIREELGKIPNSTKSLTEMLGLFKNSKSTFEKAKKEDFNISVAGVLTPLTDRLFCVFEQIADLANKQSVPSQQEFLITKSPLENGRKRRVSVTGFRHTKTTEEVAVVSGGLQKMLDLVYNDSELKEKFLNPLIGITNEDLKIFNVKLNQNLGKSSRRKHEVFLKNVIVGRNRVKGDRVKTWFLNSDYRAVFI